MLLGLSGGVDSSVVAALLHEALGDQLICVFVDTGLLRLHEGDQVMDVFAEHLGVKVIRVNAAERFLKALAGVADPEAKRKIIGRQFVEVFDEEAGKLKDVKWLAQGTIYPDVIESAGTKTGKAHVDQVPPQRRRPAREHEAEARRAASGSCSRTRSAAWASSSACPARWSTVTRSPARASACGSWAR